MVCIFICSTYIKSNSTLMISDYDANMYLSRCGLARTFVHAMGVPDYHVLFGKCYKIVHENNAFPNDEKEVSVRNI